MWRNAATADALERALSRRSARREAEESLHPLLDLADELVSVGARGPALRPEFRRELHDRLLVAAAERAQQPSGVTATAAPVAPRRSAVEVEPLRAPVPVVVVLGRSWRHAAAGVLASALVAVGTTATASTGAMPGDALYTVKRGIEDVQLHLVTSEADLGQLHLHRAERRLEETRVLLGRGDGESAVRAAATLDEYEDELAAGTGLLVAAHADGDDDALEVLDAFRQEREIELPSQPDQLAPMLEEDVERLEDVIAGNGGVTADDGGPGVPAGTPDAGENPGDGGGAPAPSPTTSDGTPSDSPTADPSGSADAGSGTSTTGQPTGSATGSGTGTGTATESGAGTPTESGTGSATGSGTGTETESGSSTPGSSTGTPTGPSSSPEASGTGSPAPGAGGVSGSGTTGPSSSGTPSAAGTGSPGTSSASDTTSSASQPPTATAPAEDDGTDVVAAPGDGPRPAPSPSAGTESTTASHAPSSTASSTPSNPNADPDGPAEGEDGTIQASDTPTGTATSTETASVDVG